MPRVTIKRLMIWIALAGVPLALACLHYRGRRHIEVLNSPHQVVGWSPSGLILDDGRRILLPKIRQLPPVSEVLSAVIAQGVEVAPDGRVTGLLRCRHWCGNDPIRDDIRRVDVADLLIFLKVVDHPIDPEIDQCDWQSRTIPLERWDPGDFGNFRLFREWVARNPQRN
jgi:hypothetical protein